MISVVMPIYLGPYATAAKDRERKIVRAIESVKNQTYNDVELIGVIDGCKVAESFFKENKDLMKLIKLFALDYDKGKKFKFNACNARNAAIELAGGDIICYLDIDDYFMPDHLENIAKNFTDKWVFFSDWMLNDKNEWYQHIPNIGKQFNCGTCNIAHSKEVTARWKMPQYGRDDWYFITELKHESDGKYIGRGGYRVCHWPGSPLKYDV